jgi:DNA-binding NtrC family response regulator
MTGAPSVDRAVSAIRFGATAFLPKPFSAEMLAEHIGQLRDERTKAVLASTNIIECTDGKFRQPGQVYLPTQEVREIFDKARRGEGYSRRDGPGLSRNMTAPGYSN